MSSMNNANKSTIISITLTSNNEKLQTALFIDTDNSIRVFTRTAPTADKPSPHWLNNKIGSGLDILDEGDRLGAIASFQSFLRRKITDETTDWTIGGVWTAEITEKARKDFDGGVAQPQPLFNQIGTAMKDEEPARETTVTGLRKAVEWLVEGPVTALIKGEGLEVYTESKMKTVIVSTAPVEERLKPIELEGGRTFYPKMKTEFGMTDVEFLQRCYEHNIPILITSDPGTGKSVWWEAAFQHIYKAKGVSFLEDGLVMGSESTNEDDLTVGFKPLTDGTFEVVWNQIAKAADQGYPVAIDEALLIDSKVLACVYSLNDGRRILKVTGSAGVPGNTIYAKPGFYMGFMGNPNAPGAILSEALKSRAIARPTHLSNFDLALSLMGPDHEDIVTVARSLETKRREGTMSEALQFRALMGYKTMYDTFGPKIALSNLLTEFSSDADRNEARDIIQRVMGVSNIPDFTI